jgi:hypothetical protein
MLWGVGDGGLTKMVHVDGNGNGNDILRSGRDVHTGCEGN